MGNSSSSEPSDNLIFEMTPEERTKWIYSHTYIFLKKSNDNTFNFILRLREDHTNLVRVCITKEKTEWFLALSINKPQNGYTVMFTPIQRSALKGTGFSFLCYVLRYMIRKYGMKKKQIIHIIRDDNSLTLQSENILEHYRKIDFTKQSTIEKMLKRCKEKARKFMINWRKTEVCDDNAFINVFQQHVFRTEDGTVGVYLNEESAKKLDKIMKNCHPDHKSIFTDSCKANCPSKQVVNFLNGLSCHNRYQ